MRIAIMTSVLAACGSSGTDIATGDIGDIPYEFDVIVPAYSASDSGSIATSDSGQGYITMPPPPVDFDNDGFSPGPGGDCDDTDPNVFPGAIELCDGINNGCIVSWTEADEAGLITYTDAFGASSDATPDFMEGAPNALIDVELQQGDTYSFCEGTYFARFEMAPGATATVNGFASDVSLVTIDASSTNPAHTNAVHVPVGATLNLNGITVRGVTDGSGIRVDGTATLDGAVVTENEGADGAGVYVTGDLTMVGAEIEANIATSHARGVGLFVADGATARLTEGSSVAFNARLEDAGFEIDLTGAGVYVEGGATLDVFASDITGNGGSEFSVGVPLGQVRGGGLYLATGATFANDGLQMIANTAGTSLLGGGSGGGIYAETAIDLVLPNAVIQSNGARNGGGIYLATGSTLQLEAATLQFNRALDLGGGVFTEPGVDVTTIDPDLGAIYDETVFISNTADRGGALFLNGSTANIESALLVSNIAAQGAGVYASSSTVSMSGLTQFTNNISVASFDDAILGDGTALYSLDSDVSIVGGVFAGYAGAFFAANISIAGNGAAIFASGGTLTTSDMIFDGNLALRDGGAVYLTDGAQADFERPLFLNNEADFGAGAYIGDSASMVATGVVDEEYGFVLNTAGNVGGAVYLEATGSFTATNLDFGTYADGTNNSPNDLVRDDVVEGLDLLLDENFSCIGAPCAF